MPAPIHDRRFLEEGEVVVVKCNKNCEVRLADDTNFERLQKGENGEFYGGFYSILPAKIIVPSSGYWNLLINLGIDRDKTNYDINYVRAGT